MKNRKNRKWMQLTRRGLMYLLVMMTVVSAVMPGMAYALEGQSEPKICTLCQTEDCTVHDVCEYCEVDLLAKDAEHAEDCQTRCRCAELRAALLYEGENLPASETLPVAETLPHYEEGEHELKCPLNPDYVPECEICAEEHETEDCTKCPQCKLDLEKNLCICAPVCKNCLGMHKTEDCNPCTVCKAQNCTQHCSGNAATCLVENCLECAPTCINCNEKGHEAKDCTKCVNCKQNPCICTPTCENCLGAHKTEDCKACETCKKDPCECVKCTGDAATCKVADCTDHIPLFDKTMAALTALDGEARGLSRNYDTLKAFHNRLMDVYVGAWENYDKLLLDDAQIEAVDAKTIEIEAFLMTEYRFDPYADAGGYAFGWNSDATGYWYEYDNNGNYYTNGFYTIDGSKYYFDANGYMAYGWRNINGKRYYFGAANDGAMKVSQWIEDTYYVGSDGAMVTNAWVGDYWCGPDGAYVKNAWVDNGNYYVGNDGKCVKNAWVQGYWCGPDGKYIKTGWVNDSGTYYYIENEAKVTGWKQISGIYYYFDANGVMQKNKWVDDCYLSDSGAMLTGWQSIGGNWYYLAENGVRVTGDQKLKWNGVENWYYFNADGSLYTGWREYNGHDYYYDTAGMATGHKTIGEKTYHFNSDGTLVSNYGPVTDSGSTWDYYRANSNLYKSNAPAAKNLGQKPVDADYAWVVLGENSATSVESNANSLSSKEDAANYTSSSTGEYQAGWGVGLGDCVGSLVFARHGYGGDLTGYKDDYSTIIRRDGGNYFYTTYHNIGKDKDGNTICLTMSLYDYAIANEGVTPRIGFTTAQGLDWAKYSNGQYVPNSDYDNYVKNHSGTYIKGPDGWVMKEYVKDNAPGVSAYNIAWVTVQYEFTKHNSGHSAVKVKGSTSYYDIDGCQGVHLHGNTANNVIATNGSQVAGKATIPSVLSYGTPAGADPAGNNGVFVYNNTRNNGTAWDNTDYTTSCGFTEQFTTDNNGSMYRTFVFENGGGIYHDAEPVVPPGTISVTKSIPADTSTEFTVNVQLAGGTNNQPLKVTDPKNGTRTVMLNASGTTITAKLKHGQTLKIENVPANTTYTVTETGLDTSKFKNDSISNSQGTVHSKDNIVSVVTNSRSSGNVTIKKISSDGQGSFRFRATLTQNFPGTTSKTQEFTLAHNGTKIFENLPLNAKLTIEEIGGNGFYSTVVKQGTTILSTTKSTSGTITIGTTNAEVVFTNTRKTGSVKIIKSIESGSTVDTTTREYNFTAELSEGNFPGTSSNTKTFTLTGNNPSLIISGLPMGATVKITEAAPDNMTTSPTTREHTVTVGDGTTVEATFVNTRRKGNATITKIVDSASSVDTAREYEFKAVLMDGSAKLWEETFKLKHGQTKSYSDLPTGAVLTVTENDYSGDQIITKIGSAEIREGTVTIGNGNTQNITFTNTRPDAVAVVTKVVVSTSSADTGREYKFTAKYIDVDKDSSRNFPGGVTVKIGSAAAVAVPNNRNEYSFILKGTQTAEFHGLPKGSSIQLTENEVPANMTVRIDSLNGTESTTVTVPTDGHKQFYNIRQTAPVTVKKTVTGGIVDAGKEFTFTATLKDKNTQGEWSTIDFPNGNSSINFTLKHNQPYTFENLPVGAQLTIEENSDENYNTTNSKPDGNNSLKAVYVVKAAGSNEEIVFTNALKNNTIVVEKKVEQDFDSKTEFQFTAELYFQYAGTTDAVKVNFPASAEADKAGNSITFNADRSQASFTLKGGEKAIFKGLPVGSILKVQEAEADFFTTVNTHKDGTDAKASLQVALTEGTITYTNTRKLGEVKISKTVVGSAADPDKVFEFEATLLDPRIDPAVAISFPDAVKTIDGVKLDLTGKKASFSLKDGQSITLTGLYEGTVLKIIEKEADFFDVTVDPASGEQTVDTETPKEIKFTNTRQLAPVTVKKEITGEVIDPTIAFTFTAQLFDTETAQDPIPFPQAVIDGAAFTMKDDNKTAVFTLRHGESITFPDLYVGSKLVINETRDDRFDPSNTAGTGVHAEYIVKADGENETIAYTNKLLNGSLKILKTVAGPIIDKEQEFEFTATLWKPLWDDNREPVLDPETKEQQLEQIPFHKKVSGSSFIGTLFDESVKITLSDDNMTATFVLKHEDVAILQNLYIGSVVKVSETEHRNYETTNSVTPDSLDAQMMIEGVKRQQIEYKNAIKLTSLTIDKTVTGNLGEREREFSFTVNMKDKYDNVLAFKVPAGVDYDVATNTATFTLTHHSDPITLTEIPVGAIVTIQEGIRDYKMSAKLNGMEKFEGEKQDDPELKVKNDTVTFHVVDAVEDNVEIINHKDVKVDTGISLDSLPWIVVLGGVAAAAALMVLRRRRYDED